MPMVGPTAPPASHKGLFSNSREQSMCLQDSNKIKYCKSSESRARACEGITTGTFAFYFMSEISFFVHIVDRLSSRQIREIEAGPPTHYRDDSAHISGCSHSVFPACRLACLSGNGRRSMPPQVHGLLALPAFSAMTDG